MSNICVFIRVIRGKSVNNRLFCSFQLVQQFGLEADRHYLRCLFSSIDFGDIQAAKSSSQAKLLSNELTALLDKPYLISNICYAFDNQINDPKVIWSGICCLVHFQYSTRSFCVFRTLIIRQQSRIFIKYQKH